MSYRKSISVETSAKIFCLLFY
ncbi:MAG: hypothetical protein PWP46_1825, partial [Fusobacteriaceae bacterium]|nr:hypothetical protein [Fusobacteriaceae bacterium]